MLYPRKEVGRNGFARFAFRPDTEDVGVSCYTSMKTRETFNAAVLKRDGHQCVICRAKDGLTVHHILDRSLFLLLKMLLVSIMGALDAMRTNWKRERDLIQQMQKEGDIVLSFGWNSMGMGIKRGYKIIEGMLVCHGVGHYDTLCMAEKRM